MTKWNFLTIAEDPGLRLRDIADVVAITERARTLIVTALTEDGYIVKEKEGRRNRYHIQDGLPLRESVGRQRAIRP